MNVDVRYFRDREGRHGFRLEWSEWRRPAPCGRRGHEEFEGVLPSGELGVVCATCPKVPCGVSAVVEPCERLHVACVRLEAALGVLVGAARFQPKPEPGSPGVIIVPQEGR